MRTGSGGFTLVEVVIALLLVTFGVIAVVPMFLTATKENAVAADLGWLGAAAVERMETQRAVIYKQLPVGGSLESDTDGFTDTSNPQAIVRWQVVQNNNPPTKTITVRAIARRQVVGRVKQVTLVTVRSY